MMMTGAKIVMECLLEQGVDTIFGYPGGTILNVYDEIYRYSDKIRHILTAHEQGASHAADGYARATGRVGVCFATSGPGATNLTTGIATAYMDSSPVVFISCNVAESLLGRDTFQEVDITGITMPITKANYLVRDVSTLADIFREAFYIAASGRPGPVFIDIPKNISAAMADFTPLPKSEHVSHGHLKELTSRASHGFKSSTPPREDVEQAARLIAQAQRPVIMCGGGVVISDAASELTQLAEAMDAPTCTTLMGIGGIPAAHPLCTGLVGMHGTRASNLAVSRCDLLLAVGCRFSDRVALDPSSFAKNAKVVHIDIDRAEIDKNIRSYHSVVGDAKEILTALCALVSKRGPSGWSGEIAALKTPLDVGHGFHAADIMAAVDKATGGDAVIVTDVGQHQMWAAQSYGYKRPRQFITSGGFGTMGFGLGAAMGASLGLGGKPVIHIAGDGCFRMNCHELCTEEHFGIPVITVVFDNGTLGMVRQWQTLIYGGRYSQTTLDRGPDFVKLAEAYGVKGYRVSDAAALGAALDEALASGRGAVIDCVLDMDDKVRPMVEGGHPLDEFILE